MIEFYKKYSAHDLYGFPKECQDCIDLALTSPTAEEAMTQKNFDLAILSKFQHIHEAKVLGFVVEPYVNINIKKLSFSLDDI